MCRRDSKLSVFVFVADCRLAVTSARSYVGSQLRLLAVTSARGYVGSLLDCRSVVLMFGSRFTAKKSSASTFSSNTQKLRSIVWMHKIYLGNSECCYLIGC